MQGLSSARQVSLVTSRVVRVLAALAVALLAALALFLTSDQHQRPAATSVNLQDSVPSELTSPMGPNDQDSLGPLGQASDHDVIWEPGALGGTPADEATPGGA